ncbi:MAG: glycoside hydrolase family 113 [Thermoleophilia bacterium]
MRFTAMKRTTAALLLFLALASAAIFPSYLQAAAPSGDPLPWSIRGFNYPSWWHDEYLTPSSTASLASMAGTGANWAAIIPTQYMDTTRSNTIGPENGGQGRTASPEATAKAIDDAHAQGMKVMLKPHVDVMDGTSRVDIQPENTALWFNNYKRMVVDYARLSEANHVEMLAIGTELAGVSGQNNYAYWADLIAEVRSVYHGPITYAASMNEYGYMSFGGLLDYLGLDVYFPLSDNSQPTLVELMTGWTSYHGYYGEANWINRVEQWQAYWNKPVIFTELGYRSIRNAAHTPWDCSPGQYDGENQALAYEAVFRMLGNKPWLAGVLFWDWQAADNSGGAGDTNYTIQGKPAAAVVASWFNTGRTPQATLQTTANSVNWASYADYQSRRLSVSYSYTNISSGQAFGTLITDSYASNGVLTETPLPFDLGTLGPGESKPATIVYQIPQGVSSFRALTYVTCVDVTGVRYYFPETPPTSGGNLASS